MLKAMDMWFKYENPLQAILKWDIQTSRWFLQHPWEEPIREDTINITLLVFQRDRNWHHPFKNPIYTYLYKQTSKKSQK